MDVGRRSCLSPVSCLSRVATYLHTLQASMSVENGLWRRLGRGDPYASLMLAECTGSCSRRAE